MNMKTRFTVKLKNAFLTFLIILKFLKNCITRGFLIFCSLSSFTVFLVKLGANYVDDFNEVMTAGGLFFTLVFSIWQYTESVKENNCKTVSSVENELNERIDNISNHFSRALNEIKLNSEREDDKHNTEIDNIKTESIQIKTEFKLKLLIHRNQLKYIEEKLNLHLNSFGHNKTLEQQQEIVKQLADLNALVTISSEYAELLQTVKNLSKNFKKLEESLKTE